MKRLLLASVALTALAIGVLVAWYTMRQDREFQRLIALGDAALAADETYPAIEAFSGALALRPDSMLAHLKRGDAYQRRGEFPAALRDLTEGVQLDPAAPQLRELLGDVYAAQGSYDAAVEHYLTFVQLDDRSPRVLYKLALAQYRGGRADLAVAPLRQALAMRERVPEAHYLLGLAFRETGDDNSARGAFGRAVALNPAFVAAREGLADLHERAGRRRDTIEQLDALAALEPARAERLVNVAMAYARWGRTDAALAALTRADERFPESPVVSAALGRVWLAAAEAPDPDPAARGAAIDALGKSASAAGASGDTLAMYGRALLLDGDAAAAERVLRQAAARQPVEPAALRDLADAAGRLGHEADAREALRRYRAVTGQEAAEPSVAPPQ